MVARIAEKERQLRADLAEFREFMRRRAPDISRIPIVKNLVTNGDFAYDGNWVKGTGWSIGGGVASRSASSASYLEQAIRIAAGSKYKVTFDLTARTEGSLIMRLIGGSLTGEDAVSSVGSYTRFLTANWGNHSLGVYGNSSFVGSLDNVAVWEVDPADNAPWFRLPLGHRVGKRGHVFRDGPRLMSNEYEEIFRGDQAFIKPLVAPGVNTEFDVYCGIGA